LFAVVGDGSFAVYKVAIIVVVDGDVVGGDVVDGDVVGGGATSKITVVAAVVVVVVASTVAVSYLVCRGHN